MTWLGFDEWRGDRVRSRLYVRQFKAEGSEMICLRERQTRFSIKYLLAKVAICKNFGLFVVDISAAFMHARTDEENCVKVFSGINSSRFWRLKEAVNGTRRASKHWQEFAFDKFVKNYIFPTERHQSVYLHMVLL